MKKTLLSFLALSLLTTSTWATEVTVTMNAKSKLIKSLVNTATSESVAVGEPASGNKYTFVCSHTIDNAGSFKVCYRLFPKSDKLPHRQDFCYVKWFA